VWPFLSANADSAGQKEFPAILQQASGSVIGLNDHGVHTMTTDQISFYDESLKKQIEGSYVSDGKWIHIASAYGVKSVPYNDLGAAIDRNAQVLLVEKLLSELARDPDSGRFKDAQKQRDDQQPQSSGSNSSWGCGSGSGANP
jgi:hypothetical protein